jgi:hypothetical protein
MNDDLQAGGMPPEIYSPLRATAEAEGEIGGDGHNSYGIFAVEGQRLTVRIEWDKSAEFDENSAGFSISEGDETFNPDSGVFTDSEGERESTSTGTVPRTGLYTISVTAHPIATYRLRVTLE